MNANPSKKHLDKLRAYLCRQYPNLSGPILIPPELIEAAARGELPQEAETRQAPAQGGLSSHGAASSTPTTAPAESPKSVNGRRKPRKGPPKQAKDAENDTSGEKQKVGRPAYVPPWLEPAAQLVANGYTLRRALWRLGVSIPDQQLRQVYRWRLFREHYDIARAKFVAEWGSTPPKKAQRITDSILDDWERLKRTRAFCDLDAS
jgi:hypothetical protein